MEFEEKFGLKKRHTYNELVSYILRDPDKIPLPDRSSLFLRDHPIYGQIRDSLRTFDAAKQEHFDYLKGDDMAPFEPRRQDPPDVPMNDPPNPPGDDDDLMGPPPDNGFRYRDLIPPAPDPMMEGLGLNGMQPPPPPPPGPIGQMMQNAGNSFANSAGGAAGGVVGAAAGNAFLDMLGGAFAGAAEGAAEGGVAGGPLGGIAGAIVGGVGGVIGAQAAQAATNAFSTPTPSAPPNPQMAQSAVPSAMQLGLRNTTLGPTQEQIDNQARMHQRGQGPAPLLDVRTLNGQNSAYMPRDRRPKRIMSNVQEGGASSSSDPLGPRPRTQPAGIGVPLLNPTAIPANADPAPPAPPSFNELVGQIKSAPSIGSRPRERSPRRGDRRPLPVQRGEASGHWSGMPGDAREEALARRSRTIPSSQSFDISRNPKRKAETDLSQGQKRPQPFPGGARPRQGPRQGGVKRPLDDSTPNPQQVTRKPPPKPEGRLGPSGSGLGPYGPARSRNARQG